MWVDITDKVMFSTKVNIRRGRNYELDDFQTGACQFTLDGSGRLFDSDYTAGPYYGNLKPLKQFRVLIVHAGTTYPRFRGFIEGWPQRYSIAKNTATVPVQLYDAMWVFAQGGLAESGFTVGSPTLGIVGTSRVGGGVAGTSEFSGERIGTVLDLDSWPDALRDLATGDSLMNTDDPSTGTSPLSYLKSVERSEDGFLFVARDGKVTFLNRHARYTLARMTTSQATFSDDGADGRYSEFGTDLDLDRVFNEVRRTRDGGVTQIVEDGTSRNDYRRRLSNESGLLLTADTETKNLARSFLNRYKDPQPRLPGVRIQPLRTPTASNFPAWLNRELLDRCTVEHTPLNIGTQRTFDTLLEGYAETFDTKSFEVVGNFSPFYDPTPFIVGHATKGVVGSRYVVH